MPIIHIQDDFQTPYLCTKDFLKTGLPLTLGSILAISTVGAFFIRQWLGEDGGYLGEA